MTMYRYRVLGSREAEREITAELDLSFLAAVVAAMKLKIPVPTVRFIVESDNGITLSQSIDGYAPSSHEIFVRRGLQPMRLCEVVVHELRHCWQFLQRGWTGRGSQHCEADATTFAREFFGVRRVENDFEKLTVLLAEIGAPIAAAAGDSLTTEFCLTELKIAGHPAADKFEREWSRARTESQRLKPLGTERLSNRPVADQVAAIRAHYYDVVLPARAQAFARPHLQAFQFEYSAKGIPT